MDSVDTVEGFNHFYIYIWLLESCNDDSNLNAVPVTSACIRSRVGNIFTVFREPDYHNDSENSQKELSFSRVVVRHY